ncbi:EcsC family protein [Halalkalibacterium ligniniphilum]|uniref:EcsC family protein n=1 Tax=Halalkalibacterium ligniniphilum TaxID=1134413 RepID=UPI0003460B13|nr:EcsC family protein [Halalkalibacterium ligniniphilum]
MMKMAKQDERLWTEIEMWEERFFDHEATDLERTYQRWLEQTFAALGETTQQTVLEKIDTVMFHMLAAMQNSRSIEELSRRILNHGKVFDVQIETLNDMKNLRIEQLHFIAEQQMAKQRLLSFGQGGLTGMGGAFLLAVDVPSMVAINLRSIQQLALTYGYELKQPYEMMLILKLFHVATVPKAYQADNWDKLIEGVKGENVDDPFYYGSSEVIFEREWVQQLLRQIAKGFVISMLRKKMIQGVPLVGMVFGARMNYQFSQQVINIAHRFYQKRHLLEKYA